MSNNPREAWEQFRFAVVGPLLVAPPQPGELNKQFRSLARQQWQHPVKRDRVVTLSVATIERWYYRAKEASNPVSALKPRQRSDAGRARKLPTALMESLENQYREYPFWSVQLHYDNLKVHWKEGLPSYSTIRRFMKHKGWVKRPKRARNTLGALAAEQRLATREVRSFEVTHVQGLWHLDYHHGSLKVITASGDWQVPKLLAVMDDRSRLICHLQWYLEETTRNLVHGVRQALQKRGLPRALMTDNGAAMLAEEFTRGLRALSILHETTLPYSPYQNAKQETFWATLEGRLMAMLAHTPNLTLKALNDYTQLWVEGEYHRQHHREIQTTPLRCFMQQPSVGRDCPDSDTLTQAFCRHTTRKQRKSDGTISLEGKRFEIPNAYRHIDHIPVQYASWDLSTLMLVSPEGQPLQSLYPLDKTANADGKRRTLQDPDPLSTVKPRTDLPPILEKLMTEFSQSGLPMPYLPTGEDHE